MFQKFMKGVCTIRSMMFFKINVWDINSDFAGVSIRKMNFFLWKKDAVSPWQSHLERSVKNIWLYQSWSAHSEFKSLSFDQNALNAIHSYHSRRSQKTKVGSSFSGLLYILYDVPRGFILDFLFFSINLRDLFLSTYRSVFTNFT